MPSIPQLVRHAQRTSRRRRTERELAQLSAQSDASAQALSTAIRAMLEGSLTFDEQAWVNRIESLRDQLNASREPVSIADFGAVSADVHVSAETMAQGQIITKTVGQVCESSSKSDYWA